MWLLCGSASALLVTPRHTLPPQYLALNPRPRLLPSVIMAVSSAGSDAWSENADNWKKWEGIGMNSSDSNSKVRSDPPEKLLDLVVQCAVQSQLAYHNEFKSEVRAKWLESFLGHEHLHVERIGGHESRIVYRGLSGLNECSWRDYLATMLRGSPQEYKCRYQVGTPDTAGGPGASAQAASGQAQLHGVAAPWAAASASRAQNPYLNKEPAVREYTELIEPRRVAQGLVTIFREWPRPSTLLPSCPPALPPSCPPALPPSRHLAAMPVLRGCRPRVRVPVRYAISAGQIALEWSIDLQMLAEEGEYLAQTRAPKGIER